MDAVVALQLLLFGLVWGGLYALIAAGLNIIFGVMKILNIAHGEMLMLGAYLTFWLFTLWEVSPLLSVPLAALAMALFGILIHKVLINPIIAHSPSMAAVENATLIVFFGVLLILQNAASLLWSADYRIVTYLTKPLTLGPLSVAANRLVALGVALALCLSVSLILQYTLVGKAIRAVSQDRSTASLVGVNVRSIGLIGFGLGSAMAGIAGSLASMIYVITPPVGLLFTIKAFTVMVVGGLGSQVGTLLAGLSLGVAESFVAFWLGQEYKDVTGYVLLISFILWTSRSSAALRSETK